MNSPAETTNTRHGSRRRGRGIAAVATLALAGSLAACGGGDSEAIVVGSLDYYSSEIIAEAYSQALEGAGYTVERDFRIGPREVFMPEVEAGSIDVMPEYTGPLLQYWVENPPERNSEDVYNALVAAAPENLTILNQADATDQDAYVVTREFSEQYGVTSAADLAGVDVPLVLGANSEAEFRPNGPDGLATYYNVEVGFTPIEDSGGPLTLAALEDGSIQLAIIYTADPVLLSDELVVLEDPAELFLSSHVVPVVSDKVDAEAQAVLNEVSAALTSEALLQMNDRSVTEQLPAAQIAADWLASVGIAGTNG